MTTHNSTSRSSIVRTLLVLGASLPLVALPLFGLWVHRFLKDYRTGAYAAAFVIALAIAMHVGVLRVQEGRARLASAAWRGALAGYLAGLVAYFVVVFVTRGAAGLSAPLGRNLGGDDIFLILGFPLFLGGWLYGALVGLAVEWLRGRAEASSLH